MYGSLKAFKEYNAGKGLYFFSPNTMRFFKSRTCGDMINGRFFITSECDFHGRDRRYTIRVAKDSGDVDTVGEFRQYASAATAKRHAEKLLPNASPCANCRQNTYNPNFTCDECAASLATV